MEKLIHCIADGFSLLQGLLYSPHLAHTYIPYAAAGYPPRPPPPQQNGMVFNDTGCYTDLPRDHLTTE